jgi:Zn-dependent alcohol dehydrogenase
MKAAVQYEVGKPLVVEEVQLEEPQDDEIKVKVAACGVCRSDLTFMKGHMPAPMPIVMGHEGAGVVEKVGPKVTLVKPGDHVLMMVSYSCGHCRPCAEGKPTQCVENLPVMMMACLPETLGTTRLRKDGKPINHVFGLAALAEYAVVKQRSVVKVRADAPLDKICLMGCGITTGMGAAMNTTGIKPGESIVVYGTGGVGLAAIMGAKLVGAGNIIAVSLSERQLAVAKQLGADHLVKVGTEDPVAKVKELTGGGADYAIEAAGRGDVMAQAFASVRSGGKCVVVGMAPLTDLLTIAPWEFLLGKSIVGTVQGDIVHSVDVPRFVDMYMQGKIPLDKMISHSYTLDQVNEAYSALDKAETVRSVVKMS